MLRFSVLLALLGTFAGLAYAGDPSTGSLAATLTADEFSRAGLNKLSPGELAALETALARHHLFPQSEGTLPTTPGNETSRPTPPPAAAGTPLAKASSFGAEEVAMAKPPTDTKEQLRTHIEGSLDGFSGRAVFVLENGQIWQVRMPETVSFVRKLVNPEVVITRGTFGYKMLIVPADRVVLVKRIQ